MSTRQRLPYAVIGIVFVLFALAIIPGFLSDPLEWSLPPDADAGMRKNASNQVVCAHLNTTAGASHTTGTTTVYYHPDATTQTSAGTATHVANGVWCYTVDDATEVNADIVKLLWVNAGAVSVLQSYLTTGYDDSVAQIPVNLTHVNGTAVTADNALVGVKVNSMANDTVTANAIATDAIGAQEIAANAITSSEAANLDAAVSSRLAPTTAGRTLDVSATGEAGVDWANVGSPTTTVGLTNTTIARSDANVTHVNGTAQTGGRIFADVTHVNSTAQSGGVIAANVTHVNAVATTATFDTLSSQISAIGSGTGAALNFAVDADNTGAPLAGVTFAGSQTGTFANTLADDGTVHQIDSAANAFDLVYGFSVGAGRAASKIITRANMAAVTDTTTVSAYNFGTTSWDARTTITGTTETLRDIPLLAGHTGTSGADTGKVYIRFAFSEGDAGALVVDEAYVTAQQAGSLIGYADGAVWVKAAGTAASVPYVNCTADNPCPWANAQVVAAAVGLSRYRIINDETVTLTASLSNTSMIGDHWYLELGGQAVDDCYIEGAIVSGVASGTDHSIWEDCEIGTGAAGATIPPGVFFRTGFNTPSGQVFTAAGAGQYAFVDCYSLVAGSGTPYFTFSGASGINFRRWSGGSNITLDNTATALTMEVVTGGGQTIAVGGADVEVRGTARAVTLTGVTTDTTAQIAGTFGPVIITGADGTVRVYGVNSGVSDARTGSPTLDDFAVSNANIDTQLSGTHGSGTWEGGGTAPTVDEINDEIDARHGSGPYGQ